MWPSMHLPFISVYSKDKSVVSLVLCETQSMAKLYVAIYVGLFPLGLSCLKWQFSPVLHAYCHIVKIAKGIHWKLEVTF